MSSDEESLVLLQAETAQISRRSLNPKTRQKYKRKGEKLKEWLSVHYSHLILDDHIDLENLPASAFLQFLVSLKNPNGQVLASSTLGLYRSALTRMFKQARITMSPEFEHEIQEFFAGLRKHIADERVQGTRRLQEGKEAISFTMYRWIASQLLAQGNGVTFYSHLFLVLTWNLMCRSINTDKVLFNHLNWKEDALVVYFAQTKTSQDGENLKDPRHVYANPHMPEICPVLALALYLASYTDVREFKLFPGGNQNSRFGKALHKIFDSDAGKRILEMNGLTLEDIGVHGTRKGSATFTASGSTAGPSIIAILLRAGWKIGGVQDRYFRFEGAADYYVGRVVCGLPVDAAEFATLAPHFMNFTPEVKEAVVNTFPRLPERMYTLLATLMASLVYHDEFLNNNLAVNHPYRQSYLFRNSNVRNLLRTSK